MTAAKRRSAPRKSQRRTAQRRDTVEQITLYLHTETADGDLVARYWEDLSHGTQGAFNHEVVKIVASYLRHIGWGGEQPPPRPPAQPYQPQQAHQPYQQPSYNPGPVTPGRGQSREIPDDDDDWGKQLG